MTDEVIKPCPFCGWTTVDLHRTNEDACWIECVGCGANPPGDDSREKAIAIWNERHDESEGGGTATIEEDDDKEWQDKYGNKN